jgi:hypothetical protein
LQINIVKIKENLETQLENITSNKTKESRKFNDYLERSPIVPNVLIDLSEFSKPNYEMSMSE